MTAWNQSIKIEKEIIIVTSTCAQTLAPPISYWYGWFEWMDMTLLFSVKSTGLRPQYSSTKLARPLIVHKTACNHESFSIFFSTTSNLLIQLELFIWQYLLKYSTRHCLICIAHTSIWYFTISLEEKTLYTSNTWLMYSTQHNAYLAQLLEYHSWW